MRDLLDVWRRDVPVVMELMHPFRAYKTVAKNEVGFLSSMAGSFNGRHQIVKPWLHILRGNISFSI